MPCKGSRVMRHVLAAMLLLLSWVSVDAQPPLPAPIDPDALDSIGERFQAGNSAYADKDFKTASRAFDAVLASPVFDALTDDARYAALSRAGFAAMQLDEYRKAHALFVRASAFENADGFVWHSRLNAAYMLDDDVDAALCIAVMGERAPASLDNIPGRSIARIHWNLERSRADEAVRFRLLASLFDANWQNEREDASHMWLEYVQFLLERDDMPRAVDAAARILDIDAIVRLRVDRRFDRVVAARKDAFDVGRSLDRQCKASRSAARRHADALWPRLDVMRCLLRSRKHEDAIALADDIIAKVAAEGMQVYTDADSKFNWILDARSQALGRMERWEDAMAQLRKASRLPESGNINVSQTLNLARLYADLGRADDARDAVELVGAMSEYGRMQLNYIALLGALDRSDDARAKVHFDYLATHRDDAPDTYRAALLQTGREDEAAKVVIERLRDERHRADMLVEMQDYDDVSRTPRRRIEAERWRAIVQRPDVLAAVEKVGRIERIPYAKIHL